MVGNVFGKAFRILGLDERKRKWVLVEQDFHGNFQVNVTWFFAFFASVLDWIVLILVWFERSLHPAHVSGQSCPWLFKLMMSQAVKRTRICMDSFVSFSGKRVKHLRICCKMRWKTHRHNQGTNKALTDTSNLFFKNGKMIQNWKAFQPPFPIPYMQWKSCYTILCIIQLAQCYLFHKSQNLLATASIP